MRLLAKIELLDVGLFNYPSEAKLLIERSTKLYNTIRPHTALGHQPQAPDAIVPADLASILRRFRQI